MKPAFNVIIVQHQPKLKLFHLPYLWLEISVMSLTQCRIDFTRPLGSLPFTLDTDQRMETQSYKCGEKTFLTLTIAPDVHSVQSQ